MTAVPDHFMPANAFEEGWLAVEQETVTFGGKFAEADFAFVAVQHRFAAAEKDFQGIERGRFGRPERHIPHRVRAELRAGRLRIGKHLLLAAQQDHLQAVAFLGAARGKLHRHARVAIVVFQLGMEEHVGDPRPVVIFERHIPDDAAEVLPTLGGTEGGVNVLQLHEQAVVGGKEQIGHVEAIFGVGEHLAQNMIVERDFRVVGDPFKQQIHPFGVCFKIKTAQQLGMSHRGAGIGNFPLSPRALSDAVLPDAVQGLTLHALLSPRLLW